MSQTPKFDGIKITTSYTSPFKDEGIPFISSRETRFLKDDFVTWFTQYGMNHQCTLNPSEYQFIQNEEQENKRNADIEKKRIKKKDRRKVLMTLGLPMALMMIAAIMVGIKGSSFGRFLSSLKLLFPIFLPITLFCVFRLGVIQKLVARRHQRRFVEVDVIADAMQSGRYTAYRFEIVQKKWKESYHSGGKNSRGYNTYHFYVDFDELTLEVGSDEYKKMRVGGSAVVVMIHTSCGDTLRVLAPRG